MTHQASEFAKAWWPPIAGALLFAAAWGANAVAVSAVQKAQDRIEAKLDDVRAQLPGLVVTQANQKDLLAELRARVQSLELAHR